MDFLKHKYYVLFMSEKVHCMYVDHYFLWTYANHVRDLNMVNIFQLPKSKAQN